MIDTVRYNELLDAVDLLDQTKLPHGCVVVTCKTPEDIASAIKKLQVRGAPAIGIAAAFGVWLGLKNIPDGSNMVIDIQNRLNEVIEMLAGTRPTAVNLFWALERVRNAVTCSLRGVSEKTVLETAVSTALAEAKAILEEDIAMCRAIGSTGAAYLKDGESWLTHCNAGALATGGYGTALGVFRAAREQGKHFHVFVDETRPVLQGARLTAWELLHDGIDATLICDNMAASLMASGRINGVVVGADRITSEGFVANKIGTYGLAVLAKHHGVPFYVAAPASTFDLSLKTGAEITIEERDAREVLEINGKPIAPAGVRVYNPAFDITPPQLITAFFTNLGALTAPYAKSINSIIGGDKI